MYSWEPSTYRLWDTTYPCDCQEQINLFRHYLLAQLPEEYMRLNKKDYFSDESAWNEMLEFLEHWEGFKAQGMGINFYAKKQGVGKTFLATYVGRELIKRREPVRYIDFRTVLNMYTHDLQEQEEERIRNITVLILDEVIPPVSNAQQEFFAGRFEELIRYRSNYNRVTIMTTNLEPDELDHYYPRTFSLLSAKQKIITFANSFGDKRREFVPRTNLELALNNERRPIS